MQQITNQNSRIKLSIKLKTMTNPYWIEFLKIYGEISHEFYFSQIKMEFYNRLVYVFDDRWSRCLIFVASFVSRKELSIFRLDLNSFDLRTLMVTTCLEVMRWESWDLFFFSINKIKFLISGHFEVLLIENFSKPNHLGPVIHRWYEKMWTPQSIKLNQLKNQLKS